MLVSQSNDQFCLQDSEEGEREEHCLNIMSLEGGTFREKLSNVGSAWKAYGQKQYSQLCGS